MTRTVRVGVVAGLWLLLSVPLIVATLSLRAPTWVPVLDLAMTELRVRDVGGPHTPLIGLPGRIGDFPAQGSHPGPMSFFALALPYRLLGSTAWALQAATAVLNVVALGLSLWVAYRRGGVWLSTSVALLLALLMRGYGIETLVEPWNPYLPLLWWFATLLAAWSVLDGDVSMLPVAVVTGSFAAQTHVPYLGLVLGVGGLAAGCALWLSVQRPQQRRRHLRWVAAGGALGTVLWAPALVDQLTREPGNLSMLADHFLHPPEPPVGVATGLRLALLHLDIVSFVRGSGGASGSLVAASSDPTGSVMPGTLVLAAWAASVVVAWRLRHALLLRLQAVTGLALLLLSYSLGRIFGKLWYYLMLSAWAVTALILLSIAWTVALLALRWAPAAARARSHIAAIGVMTAAVALSSGALIRAATSVEPPAARLSRTLTHLLPPTAAALDRGTGEATGRSGRYLVTWEDAFYIGSQGYGVVNELERLGFDVGVREPWRVPVTPHRVMAPGTATARVHYATGPHIERWRSRSDAIEVAYHDPRSDVERQDYDRLSAAVSRGLREAGLGDIVPLLSGNLFGATLDPRLPDDLREQMERMLELGLPGAVFITSAGTE